MLKALANFLDSKSIVSVCPYCNSPLVVRELGESAWSIDCKCGRSKDTLRGL